jgi:pimeloyl-ACP methyl ester carboxylesterase
VGAADQVIPGPRLGGSPVDAREGELAALLPLLDATRRAATIGAGPPAPGAAPELARQWWALLTSDEQQRAVRGWPTTLGSLDGLPGAVRSAANEYRLDLDVAMLLTRSALSDDERRWLDNCLLVRSQLHRVRSARDPLSVDQVTAQLLVFDPRAYDYEGRAALAVGDVDTADHVAFLVPGLGTEVRSSMAALTGDALRLMAEARRSAPGMTTATVAWMGYDAPGFSNVGFDGAAQDGASLLVADVLAVQASRDVLPHLTVIGHSYGSTTAGTALRDRETGTDDLVLVGSPGPNVERASQLHVPVGHVFVGASSRDPISYADRFGKDPTHASFGAIRFTAEDTTRNSWRLDLDDHSKYFHDDTESLANIVDVVVGDYAAVDLAAYRDEVFLLPDGINSDPEADREPTTVP